MMMIDFHNKVYLITGGASGIGAAVVEYIVRH
ncbi:MAG: NAD(P)-dependent dehydrogenase (short-subunit alcohol dehydrogenase family) [Halioglobus sp.]|jgi:NAD(P)-dependent dehydrogenase (short-subunit alcohol dehydrogenase family)